MIKQVDFEVVLSGDHPDICVVITADENASKNTLLQLACDEAMRKTYIWSIKKLQNGPVT